LINPFSIDRRYQAEATICEVSRQLGQIR